MTAAVFPFAFVPTFSWPSVPGALLFTYAAGGASNQATYSDAFGTVPNTNPVRLDATGSATVRLDPTLSYHLVLKDPTGSTVLWDQDNYQSPFYGTVNTALPPSYAATAAEQNVAATIVNAAIPPYNPLRYATNTVPGTTDMAPALQMAMNALLGTPAQPGPGGQLTLDMSGGPYNLKSGINCTWSGSGGAPAVNVRWLGNTHNAHLDTNPSVQGCVLNHSTIGFDCTGNDTISFIDATITTALIPAPTVFPKIGILFARNTTKGSLINHCVRPKIVGYFSTAQIYNYGSEGVFIDAPYLANYGAAGAGNCNLAFTENNYANVSSLVPGLIATGECSMTICSNWAGQFIMTGANSTSDCVHLEGAGDIGFRDCFGYNPGGRSIFYVDNTFAPSVGASCNWITIDGFKVDAAGPPKYTIMSDTCTAPGTLQIGWNIRGLRSNASMYAIYFADANSYPYNWTVDPISEAAPAGGINIPGKIDGFSQFRLGATTLIVGGNVTAGTLIIGDPAKVTVNGVPGGVALGAALWNNGSQVGGFGTPINAALTANFPGTAATLAQCGGQISFLENVLKARGIIAS